MCHWSSLRVKERYSRTNICVDTSIARCTVKGYSNDFINSCSLIYKLWQFCAYSITNSSIFILWLSKQWCISEVGNIFRMSQWKALCSQPGVRLAFSFAPTFAEVEVYANVELAIKRRSHSLLGLSWYPAFIYNRCFNLNFSYWWSFFGTRIVRYL